MVFGPIVLGQAQGSITINTDSVTMAVQTVNAASVQINQAFNRMGSQGGNALSGLNSGLSKFASGLSEISGALAIVSIGLGAMTAKGFETASSIETLRLRFAGMTGSTEQADRMMKTIAESARKLNQPVLETYQTMAQLVPLIGTGEKDLAKYVSLATRLAAVNPVQGIRGAIIAITEALSSGEKNFMSLAMRFNIPRAELRQAIDDAGDFATGLDNVLKKWGITEEVAQKTAKTFTGAFRQFSSELNMFLGSALTPFADAMGAVLHQGSMWLQQLQETNPQVATLAGGVIAVGAAAGPTALALSQVVIMVEKLKNAGILGAVGKAGGIGIAGLLGAEAGVAGARGLAELGIGDPSLKNISQDEGMNKLGDRIKQLIVAFANSMVDLGGIVAAGALILEKELGFVGKVLNAGGIAIQIVLMQMLKVVGTFVELFGQMTRNSDMEKQGQNLKLTADLAQKQFEKAFDEIGVQILTFQHGLTEENKKTLSEALEKTRGDLVGGLIKQLFPELTPTQPAGEPHAGQHAKPAKEFSDEQIEAWIKFQDDLKEINKRELKATNEENEKFAERRQDLIEQTDDQIQKIEDDAALREKRQKEELGRNIAEVEAASQERRNDVVDKAEARKNKLISDWQKNEQDLTKDHEKRLEDIRKDRRKSLLDAAARLDAIEVKRILEAGKDKIEAEDDSYSERQQKLRESLSEQLDELQKSRTEQLAEIDASNNKQIAKLKANLDLQQKLQDEDKQIQINRIIEDRNKRLMLLDREHLQTLERIRMQAFAEAQAREQAFINEFNRLETHESRKVNMQQGYMIQAENQLRAWWTNINNMLSRQQQTNWWDNPIVQNQINQAIPDLLAMQAAIPVGNNISFAAGQLNDFMDPNYHATPVTDVEARAMMSSISESDIASLRAIAAPEPTSRQRRNLPEYKEGTMYSKAGLARMHEGEIVLDQKTSALVRALMGQNTVGSARQAGNGGRKKMDIGSFAPSVNIYGATGLSEAQMSRAVEEGLRNLLMEVTD